MRKIRKCIAILCMILGVVPMLIPTVFAAEGAQWVEEATFPDNLRRNNNSVAAIGDKIFVLGGQDTPDLNSIYDTKTKMWSTGEPIPNPPQYTACASFEDKIYLFGIDSDTAVLSMQIYDTTKNAWSTKEQITQFRTQRFSFYPVTIGSKIYLPCYNHDDVVVSVLIYDIEQNAWSAGVNGRDLRGACAVAIRDNIYLIGGNEMMIYNTVEDKWSISDKHLTTYRTRPAVSAIHNEIYVTGGEAGSAIRTVEIYSVKTDSWRSGPSIEALDGGETIVVDETLYLVSPTKIYLLKLTTPKISVLLNTGETTQLSVSYDLADNQKLTWFSSDSTVAAVDASGKVTAVGSGSCDITAESADSIFKESIPIRVMPGTADQFRLALHLKPAQNAKLHLTDDPADTVWKSLDSTVATVDAIGKVTAVSQGLAILEGTTHDESYQIYVRVKA